MRTYQDSYRYDYVAISTMIGKNLLIGDVRKYVFKELKLPIILYHTWISER